MSQTQIEDPSTLRGSNRVNLAETGNNITSPSVRGNASRHRILFALDLMTSYGLRSIFDAIYATTTLTPHVLDHTILSTDQVYDKTSDIERLVPETYN